MTSFQELMQELGSTSDEVADYLRKEDIKGFPFRLDMSPISYLLAKKGFGDKETVLTTSWAVFYGEFPRKKSERLPLPVKVFMLRFEAGEFPDLEEYGAEYFREESKEVYEEFDMSAQYVYELMITNGNVSKGVYSSKPKANEGAKYWQKIYPNAVFHCHRWIINHPERGYTRVELK